MNEEREKRFEQVARSKTFNNILDAFDLKNKSVLDIGCSYGEFLSCFGAGSIGITIVEEEVAYGIKKGLDVRYGNIEAKDFKLDKKFDVIFANNLFEHLHSPHVFLRTIPQYLKPGGILILGVPCIPKVVWLLRLRKFRGSLAGNHVNFFTKDTLGKTVERGGWNVLMIRGFRIKNMFFDAFLNVIYPHFYVVAQVKSDFVYSQKRLRELAGYRDAEL